MDFNHFMTSFMTDVRASNSKRHFDNIVEQAVHAEALGYKAVSLPEHHLANPGVTTQPQ